jgi:UDP-2,3-diacylglucosamine hydrolase
MKRVPCRNSGADLLNTKVKVYCLSDLHIENASDPFYFLLLEWLKDREDESCTICFAGDIFDAFHGANPVFSHEFKAFFARVRELADLGREFHFLSGNHDVGFDQVEALRHGNIVVHETAGFEVRRSDYRIWIEHGDLLNPRDYGYRFLRKIVKGKVGQSVFEKLPGPVAFQFGTLMSQISRKRKKSAWTADTFPAALQARIRAMFRQHARDKFAEGFDAVIMGHCHDFDGLEVLERGKVCRYLNMGFPKVHRHIILADSENRTLRRVNFV